MPNLHYKITFYSYWHANSGKGAGMEKDSLVIKDENGLPFIPAKTMKGLFRDAADTLMDAGYLMNSDFKTRVFGFGGDEGQQSETSAEVRFDNASLGFVNQETELKVLSHNLYDAKSSTRIGEKKQAEDYSLRTAEATIPVALYGVIKNLSEQDVEPMTKAFKMVKRLGLKRTRGFGRCIVEQLKTEAAL